MGLLDSGVFDSDQFRLGLGLLGAASARADNAGFGQRLMEGMASYDNFRKQKDAKKLADLQMQETLQSIADKKAEREQASAIRQAAMSSMISPDMANAMSMGPMPDGSAMPTVQPGFNNTSYINSLFSLGLPDKAVAFEQAVRKDNTPIKLGEGDTLVDNKTFKPLLSLPPKQTALPAAIQEYKFAVEQGYPGTFEQWSTSQKKAGATNVSNKTEVKMGESVAAQVGPMVKDTYTAANGAVQQIDAANRIVNAIDSGKIIAGPFAGGRLKVAQVGQMLGVTGRDDAETIARSREVIRGLSEMTLQGRKQMTGQGAITESESRLAEKAMSGDIADLTPAEIKQLAKASERAARFVYRQHQQNLSNLQSDPATAGIAKFYKPLPLPAAPTQSGVVNWGDLK